MSAGELYCVYLVWICIKGTFSIHTDHIDELKKDCKQKSKRPSVDLFRNLVLMPSYRAIYDAIVELKCRFSFPKQCKYWNNFWFDCWICLRRKKKRRNTNNQCIRSVNSMCVLGIFFIEVHIACRFCEIWDAIYYIMFVHRFHLDSMCFIRFRACVFAGETKK